MQQLALLLLTALVPGCGLFASAVLDVEQSEQSEGLSVRVDPQGRPDRLEYQIAPDAVPAAVRQAMERLHPGEPFLAAERQVTQEQVVWVLARLVDGLQIEAAFRTDGTLVAEQRELPAAQVPPAVARMLDERFPTLDGEPRWTELRNGARDISAYQARLVLGGRRYTVRLLPSAQIVAVWRQLPAELEVPVRMP